MHHPQGGSNPSRSKEVASSQEDPQEPWSLEIWLTKWLSPSDEDMSTKEKNKKRDQVESKSCQVWLHPENPKEDLTKSKQGRKAKKRTSKNDDQPTKEESPGGDS